MANPLKFVIQPVIKQTSMQIAQSITKKTTSLFKKVETTGTKAYRSISKFIDKSRRQNEKYNNSVKKSSSTFKKMLGFGAGIFSISKIKDFYSESLKNNAIQQRAETQLLSIMGNVRGLQGNTELIKEQSKALMNYASEMQDLGVIGDEVVIMGQQQLATFQLMPNTIKTLTLGMTDLLAQTKGYNATAEDSFNVGNLIGKVMNGQVGALTRVGISFTTAQEKVLKFGTEQEKASILAQVLQENVGGVNKALRETPQGQMKAINNTFGDMKERIGGQIIPFVLKFSNILLTNMPTIEGLIVGFTAGLIKTFDIGVKIISFLNKYKSIIIILTAAYIAYNVTLKAFTIYQNRAIAKQVIWNAVMNANPVGLVVAGVVALITAGVLLYKNWDTVKEKAIGLWEIIKENPFLNLLAMFNPITLAVVGVIKAFKLLGSVINFFKGKKIDIDTQFNTDELEKSTIGNTTVGSKVEQSSINNITSNNDNKQNVNITIPVSNNVDSRELAGRISKAAKQEVVEYNRQQLAMAGGK